MKRKFYFKKSRRVNNAYKKKPIMISRDIMLLRVRFNKKLRYYKSKIFQRYKRFTFFQKKFFKKLVFRSKRRSDLLFLNRQRKLYDRWIPRRLFSRKLKRDFLENKRLADELRSRYFRKHNYHYQVKTRRFQKKTPKVFRHSKFRYQLGTRFFNRKEVRLWLDKRFFSTKKHFVFRLFHFTRKLHTLRIDFKARKLPDPTKRVNKELFFKKYRKFALWVLTRSWTDYYPRRLYSRQSRLRYLKKRRMFLRKVRRLNNKLKRRRSKNKLKKKTRTKKKSSKLFKKWKKYPRNFFARFRKYVRFLSARRRRMRRHKRDYRKIRQRAKFLRLVRLAYKFPHNRNKFKVLFPKKFKKFKFLNPNKFFSLSPIRAKLSYFNRPHSYKLFKFSRPNRKRFFYTKRRLPKILYKNFFSKSKAPLAYYFTRKSKKLSVYFKTFKKRRYISRFLKFKHRSRVPFRIKRILNKLRFYLSTTNRSRLSIKINRKVFFVRRKYAYFLPYLGYFRRFGRKRFLYKRKRKKFFRFFKKFFSKYQRSASVPTLRYRFYKSQASKVKFFIHIFRSVNNMFVNVSAPRGRTLYAYSAGRTNFRGSKRLSPIAIETMGKAVSLLLKNSKVSQVGIVFHTPIDYLVRALMRGFRTNIKFTHFKYYMTKPHNGLRLRATRRV